MKQLLHSSIEDKTQMFRLIITNDAQRYSTNEQNSPAFKINCQKANVFLS